MKYHLRDQLTTEEKEVLISFVAQNPQGNLYQRPVWVSVFGRDHFLRYLYFWGEEGREIEVSALIKRMELPGLGWARDVVEWGPVCSDSGLLCEATAQLARLLKARGSVYLKVHPYWTEPAAGRVEADLASLGFRALDGDQAHSYGTTLTIDLTEDEEEILRGLGRSTRYKLRKSEKMGLEVSLAQGEEDIHTFFVLYKEMAIARGLKPLAEEFLIRLWREFLADQEHGVCLVARYHGEVVSADIVLKHGTRAEYIYGASVLGKFPDLPKNHLCFWKAILWAKEQGCTMYDFGGYLPDAPEGSPIYGINRFKSGFSKSRVDLVHEHERVFSPSRYRLMSLLWLTRQKALLAKNLVTGHLGDGRA